MRAVIQRVKQASADVSGKRVGEIESGLCILLGIQSDDSEEDILWLSKKILNLRVFADADGSMNESLIDQKKEILLISQFTLYANVKKGNRPSFMRSAPPEIAEPLYEKVCKQLEEDLGRGISKGIFGANMEINLCNDGPVTLIIDTKNREL